MHARVLPHIRTLCISAYSRQGVGKRAYSPQVRIFTDVLHIHAYSSLVHIFITNTHIRRHHAYSRIFTDTLHIRAYTPLARIRTDTPHTRTPAMYAHTRRHAAHSPEARTLPRRFPEPANTAFRLVGFAQVFSRAC